MIVLLDAQPVRPPEAAATRNASPASRWQRDRDEDGGAERAVGHRHHHGGLGALGQALRATLGQLGLIGRHDDDAASTPTASGSTTTITATITITVSMGAPAPQATTTTGASNAPAPVPASAPAPAPAPASGNASATPVSTTTPSTPAAPTTTAPADLRTDIHSLMHALFKAIRAQGGATDLGSALGALATQAGQGQAPAALQQAFDTLVGDALDSAGTERSSSRPTLQQFLQALQQQIGGGADEGGSRGNCRYVQPAGNLLSVSA